MSRISRALKIGGFAHVDAVTLGGGNPPVIQTMWKESLSADSLKGKNGEAYLSRIQNLRKMGCGLLRFAVPDLPSAEILGSLASMVSMPLVADIHFDYKIALRCLDFPIAKIRINPGNIGGQDRVRALLEKAAEKDRPIRIGVNAGSLPPDLREKTDAGSLSVAQALAAAAEREIAFCSEFGFSNVIVSMKASSVADTIKANRIFASGSNVPLHVGVTEAGPLIAGAVRNAAALTVLLGEGIGDTLRVSLSDSMENEVIAAGEILEAVRDMTGAPWTLPSGVRLVSCPRCGRCSFDTHGFTSRWLNRFYAMEKNITVAVMGCAVNGPGEARHADLGITGAGGKVLIFRRGELVRIIDAAGADDAFAEELDKI